MREFVHYSIHGLVVSSNMPLLLEASQAELCDYSLEFTQRGSFRPLLGSSRVRLRQGKSGVFLNFGLFGKALFDGQKKVRLWTPAEMSTYERTHFIGNLLSPFLSCTNGGLIVHASAVKIGNLAFLFFGGSTSGKSCTAALLNKEGFEVLSDDISVLNKSDGRAFHIMPGLPFIELRSEASDLGDLKSLECYSNCRAVFRVRQCRDAEYGGMFLLTLGSKIAVSCMSPLSAFCQLLRHSCFVPYMAKTGSQSFMDQAAGLMQKTNCWSLSLNHDLKDADLFVRTIVDTAYAVQ